MEIRFRRRWEAAHRFYEDKNRSSKCSQPHGHSWHVEVAISKESPQLDEKTNMLKSFEDLKKKWHTWIDEYVDHAFMVNKKDPILDFLKKDNPEGRLLITPGDPTTEILAVLFKSKLEAFLSDFKDEDFYVQYVKIEETPTNSVVFDGKPSAYLPDNKEASFWWQRGDFSTKN